ncbi:phage tail tube protein [Paraburkholderia sediminicola]|nr:phage tail tube protein [Paraburkholderia sediminicola]
MIGRNMWIIEVQAVKTPEATFQVKFEGFSGRVIER